MTALRSATRLASASRFASAAVLGAALLCTAAACGTGAPTSSVSAQGGGTGQSGTTWEEPASYTYTLKSSAQVLYGTFRVTVREGKGEKIVGLDDESRLALRHGPAEVPTIGNLLERLEQARREGAHTAEAEYADGGRPARITLDGDRNAIDDEARYTISAYEPSAG
ncbi:hypothetical protein H9Y04_01525 [Streptomyces sp. TRM66268-LWL]|uniref:Lipoprotein n=1 Tax=Streptomyces polyasparticus TaxID=2767826 RepID=A0ABR7S906_9ACTN|nr:DUF6174 domain-containing protein [Streptomyces polyasparticus]MBC9711250.1 hypothetical protein [Streptomyces polyasparticus]